MAEPFATTADLTARGFTVTDETLAGALLQDASEYLRAELGWQVYPVSTVTIKEFDRHRDRNRFEEHIFLPGHPVRSVVSVNFNGVDLDLDHFELVDNVLLIRGSLFPVWFAGRLPYPTVVTYTVGYDTPPPELVSWTCVIAADQLAKRAQGLQGAVPAAVSVDDFKVQYSAQQQAGEPAIPPRVLERLRGTYGTSVYVR